MQTIKLSEYRRTLHNNGVIKDRVNRAQGEQDWAKAKGDTQWEYLGGCLTGMQTARKSYEKELDFLSHPANADLSNAMPPTPIQELKWKRLRILSTAGGRGLLKFSAAVDWTGHDIGAAPLQAAWQDFQSIHL